MSNYVSPDDACNLVEPVLALSTDAGQRIMDIYHSKYTIDYKSDGSPVTDADRAAHNAIQAGLDILTPEIPMLSEESPPTPFAQRRLWDTYWLVDPLDGTREFIKANGNFAVIIALIHQQQAILGVIHIPISGTSYYACKDKGAFKMEAGHSKGVPIHTRKKTQAIPTIAISRSRRGKNLEKFLRSIGSFETVAMGSALKACMVAEGRADVYPCLGATSEWDTAAAHIILEEAGGSVVKYDSKDPLEYNKENLLNPHFLL